MCITSMSQGALRSQGQTRPRHNVTFTGHEVSY